MAKKHGPCSKLFQAPLWGCHFFILSRAPLKGFSISLSLLLCLCPHFFFSFFFILWSFFPCMPQFLQALWFFFIVPSLLSQGFSRSFSLSLTPSQAVYISLLYFLLLWLPSVSFCRTSIYFHWLLPPQSNFTHFSLSSSLQPLCFLHLSPFDQEPVCSFPFPPILHLLL